MERTVKVTVTDTITRELIFTAIGSDTMPTDDDLRDNLDLLELVDDLGVEVDSSSIITSIDDYLGGSLAPIPNIELGD